MILKNFKFYIVILIFTLSILNLAGCASGNILKEAQRYTQASEAYYQAAVNKYKDLIAKGKDLDKLHFQLGRLYFNHGEFRQAVGEFKKSNDPQAKKFLAISYYQLGNFTDALEIFNQEELVDDEYLYYKGSTCERLNLFDKALDAYKKIKSKEFSRLALERSNIIEKQTQSVPIKDIDPKINQILASAPLSEKYSQAGALILYCDEKIEITPQNTQISYLHYVIKILNERGKESFSESHIDYDSTYEKIELEYARTIKPDGTVVDVGARHLRDVSKYLNFPLYSNVRVFIISFPEVTEGATIEYKVKVYRNQLIDKKNFVLSYPLQSSEPIIQANFEISLPRKRPLYIKTLNEEYNNFGVDLQPQIKQQENSLIYSWRFMDIPQIIPEANMPAQVEVNPTILISTFNSWQEVYQWWWNLAKDKIKVDEDMQDKVRELTEGLESTLDKVKAIYNFCAKEIRYVAVEYGQAGYEPHKAELIFRNKYGDCKDQAILLIALLKEIGVSAWPVLIATKDYYNLNADFPAVLFNHCIVAVSLEDKTIFLDPTQETTAFGDLPSGDQQRKVLVFKENTYEIQTTPLYSAEHNFLKQNLRIKISPDETIEGEKSIFTYGIYDQAQRLWLLYTPPELIQEQLQTKIQEISIGARLNTYQIKNLDDLNQPTILNYTFQGPEYFIFAGALRIMPQLAALDTAIVAKDKRKYPIDLDILDEKETLFEVEIPKNLVIKYIPPSLSEDSPWFKFTVEYKPKDNKIIFKQKITRKKNIVNLSEYLEFKRLLEGLAKRLKQRIVLEKIK